LQFVAVGSDANNIIEEVEARCGCRISKSEQNLKVGTLDHEIGTQIACFILIWLSFIDGKEYASTCFITLKFLVSTFFD
jgi:hypothetical protein